MEDVFVFGDNGDVKEAILFLTAKLPEDLSRRLMEECIVVVVSGTLNGFYLPSEIVNGRGVIALNYSLYSKSYDRFIRTFFHEAAHHILGHSVLFGKNSPLEKRQEAEAEALVSSWLLRAD